MKINTSTCIDANLKSWADENDIKLSPLLNEAIKLKKKESEKRTINEVSEEDALIMINFYKTVVETSTNELKKWEIVYDHFTELNKLKVKQEAELKQKEARIKVLLDKEFVELKKKYTSALMKLKGYYWSELREFIRAFIPQQHRSFFNSIAQDICLKENGRPLIPPKGFKSRINLKVISK